MRLTVGELKKIVKESILEAEEEAPKESASERPQAKPGPVNVPDQGQEDFQILGDSRGDAIDVIIAILKGMDAPTDYSLKGSDDAPAHHRHIATMLVDKVRKYSSKSVYRLRFKISRHSIKAMDDNRTVATMNLDGLRKYITRAIKLSTSDKPWGELVMDYDWSRRTT